MKYKIVEVLPRWENYTVKVFIPKEGAAMVEFAGGTARTSNEAIAEHFRKNPLRYIVETE